MIRLYEPAAYAPLKSCWWADTVTPPAWPRLTGDTRTDVCIIGGGFTGLSAALHLAQAGTDVTVVDAQDPAFGASGRNGGFCCIGGSVASSALLKRQHGHGGLASWRAAEIAAIETVANLIRTHDMQVDRHSKGEVLLAHSPRHARRLIREIDSLRHDYPSGPTLLSAQDLPGLGIGGPFHGGLHMPFGFALNPRKYHTGLARVAQQTGVRCYALSPATDLRRTGARWQVQTPSGYVTADQVIIATNGYASDDMPPWLAARYLPVQSSVLVTRPLTRDEQAAQGWTSDLMAYDSRGLLHYFRKLPDDRFLFGMRGGIRATPRAERATLSSLVRHFHAMFPHWAAVDITHRWQGLACLMADATPFAGPVPEMPGVHTGMGYHGNGVAMGTYVGKFLANSLLGSLSDMPGRAVLQSAPGKLPFGRWRRAILWPLYAAAWVGDWSGFR